MNFLLMIGVAPLSWRLGRVRWKPGKSVWALGPLRLSLHDLDYQPVKRFDGVDALFDDLNSEGR